MCIFSFAVHYGASYTKARNKQQDDPEDHVAVVAGLRYIIQSAGVRIAFRRIGRLGCGTGSRDLNSRTLIATEFAFLMLGTLFDCSCFLIYHPLEAVCCTIVLDAAGAFMPVVDRIRFPIRAVAVGMLAAAGCRNRTGFQYTVTNGAFLMLRAVSGSRCCGVGDPFAGGMSCFVFL